MNDFTTLGLSRPILDVIAELGFERPSEIQAKAIPQLLRGKKDFIGLAQTGTGKTAAFGIPILERVSPENAYTQALIIAPTRELGQQIAKQLEIFSKYIPHINVLAVYGGASIGDQMRALKKKPQHVIIATPGRLIDLINRKAVKLNQLRCLVLDEADEMLNMGFKEDIDQILQFTPDDKMIWLFSATMSSQIRKIVKTYMEDPAEVSLNHRNETNTNIDHQYTVVKQSDKMEALSRFLDASPEIRAVVFCRTRRDTQDLSDKLRRKNYQADSLHGDLSQAQRDRVMSKFRNQDLQILVATDIAARGIDVDDLTHVFHYALPDEVAYYTHRSGRTARAGKKGISMALVHSREKAKINRLSKELRIDFAKVDVPSVGEIYESRIESWAVEILNKKTKGKIDSQLLDKINILFANLSKEELTAKFLMQELDKVQVGESKDLNATMEPLDKDKKYKVYRPKSKKNFRSKHSRPKHKRRRRDN